MCVHVVTYVTEIFFLLMVTIANIFSHSYFFFAQILQMSRLKVKTKKNPQSSSIIHEPKISGKNMIPHKKSYRNVPTYFCYTWAKHEIKTQTKSVLNYYKFDQNTFYMLPKYCVQVKTVFAGNFSFRRRYSRKISGHMRTIPPKKS